MSNASAMCEDGRWCFRTQSMHGFETSIAFCTLKFFPFTFPPRKWSVITMCLSRYSPYCTNVFICTLNHCCFYFGNNTPVCLPLLLFYYLFYFLLRLAVAFRCLGLIGSVEDSYLMRFMLLVRLRSEHGCFEA